MFDKKILCLGNNSADTDLMVSELASRDSTINHGLIDQLRIIESFGYYHTTVTDLIPGEIVTLSKQFDHVMLLDQPQQQWSHAVLFVKTINLINLLEESGCEIIFQNPNLVKNTNFFQELLETNKSFCIYPFIHLTSRGNGKTQVCSRSFEPVADLNNLTDWQNNSDYQRIRQDMLAGTPLPKHCGYCYHVEKDGGRGARFHETLEWTAKLNINSLEDLKKIRSPVYYEIRPSNKCNLQCRSCVPRDSHLIDKEFKSIGITDFDKNLDVYDQYTGFDVVDIDSVERLYVAGGEPTIMPELYEFLRKCIDQKRTNFEFMINTNAVKISKTLLDLFKNFSHLGFSVSLDGVGPINDYIRWPGKFEDIVKNTHTLIDQGHHVAFISVVSIYNVTSLHKLLEFQDQEFHGVPVMLQFDTFKDDIQSPYNHPNIELALESLEKCKMTSAYFNYSRGTKSIIDQLYDHYNSNPQCNLVKLEKFAKFNELLDQSRKHKLEDYIPELSKELLRFQNK
jgi:sulfatase maturation enzyme AslB (radical SAM superfamily)